MTETLWKFKTKNFTITWDISPCDQLDLSFDETGEVRDKINSGEYIAFDSEINVMFRGQSIGSSHLGDCIYADPKDFRDHIGINANGHGSYFSDMVREAVDEARKTIADLPPTPVLRK